MQNPFEVIEQKLNELTEIITELNDKLTKQRPVESKPFNMNDAAKYLDISKPTLYALTSKREIPHMKRGKKLYFDKVELEIWLKEHRKRTVDEIKKQGF